MPTPSAPSRPHRRRRLGSGVLALLATSALLLGATACSDDDEGGAVTTTTEDPAGDTAGNGEGDGSSTTTDGTPEPDGDDTTTTAGGDAGPLPELTAEEQPYADAVLADFTGEGNEFLAGADNECLATRWVHAIGGEALVASGMTPEDFADDGPAELGIDRATAEEMVDVMELCGAGLDLFYEGFATGFDPDGEVDEELLACLKEAAPVALLRDAMVTSFMGDDDEGMDALDEKWQSCMPDDVPTE